MALAFHLSDASSTALAGPPPDSWRRASARLPELHAALRGAVHERGRLGEAARHHLSTPGRCFRGLLALATGEVLGLEPGRSLGVALACELLHAASLVHDDLEDRDVERRGQATVWHRFGDSTALHLGDLLIARCFEVLARLPVEPEACVELLRRFSDTTQRAIRGQAAEASALARSANAAEYESCARRKTGALLALPVQAAQLGQVGGNRDEQEVEAALSAFGTAYQIQDDLLDLFGRKPGRSAGTDLRAGRLTAPALKFLETAPAAEGRRLRAFLRGRHERWNAGERWAERLRGSPAIDACLARIDELEAEGQHSLASLEAPLRGLLGFAATRILDPSRELRALRPRATGAVLRALPAAAVTA